MSDKGNNNCIIPFIDIANPESPGAGKPTTISYNVPEPQSLTGRTFIEIVFEGKIKIFKPSVLSFVSYQRKHLMHKTSKFDQKTIEESMKNGFDDNSIFPHVGNYAALLIKISIVPNA